MISLSLFGLLRVVCLNVQRVAYVRRRGPRTGESELSVFPRRDSNHTALAGGHGQNKVSITFRGLRQLAN